MRYHRVHRTRYIVSIGTYADDTTVSYNDFEMGLNRLEKVDEVTLLVSPDATLLSTPSQFYLLQQQMIQQCVKLQDRFAVFDLRPSTSTFSLEDSVAEFNESL